MEKQLEPCDTVLILGAGFSFDAGIPLMSGFVETMWEFAIRKKANGQPLSSEDAKIFADAVEVRAELDEYHGRAAFNDRNIEDILSILSFASFLPKRGRINRMAAINRAIERTIELSCTVKHPGFGDFREFRVIEEGPEMYRRFWTAFVGLKAAGMRPPSIITFNYDLVLERSLLQVLVGMRYDGYRNRFPYQHVRIDHRYAPVKAPLFKVNTSHFRTNEPRDKEGIVVAQADASSPESTLNVEILKLHGSLNFPAKGTSKGAARPANIAATVDDPLILPPIFNKQSTEAQREIWGTAMARLRSAKNIVIVGYSLPKTDIYMQYFLKAALGPNLDLNRIFVFDPALYSGGTAGTDMIGRYQECFSEQLRSRMCFKPNEAGASNSGSHLLGSAAHFIGALAESPRSMIF